MRRELPPLVRALAPAAGLLIAQAIVFPAPAGVYAGGIVLGTLGALVAVGMALVYRANRIINFAQGALGVVPTVLAVQLIVYSGVVYAAAGIVGAVGALGLGAAVQRFVIRRFAESSRLVLTAATIGIAQLLVGVSIFLPNLWGHPTRAEEITSGLGWRWFLDPIVLRAEHALAAGVAVALLALVAVALLRTSVGAGVRAAAERADLAGLLGIPVQRLQVIVWAGAALLSFAGVFGRVSIVGLPQAATDSTVALLAALAALTLGRFTHLGRIAVTAVALGVVEQAVAWNNPQHPQLFAVVLAVAIGVGLLFLRGEHTRRATPRRAGGCSTSRRLASAIRRQPAVRWRPSWRSWPRSSPGWPYRRCWGRVIC
ncbi:MAG: branched-chain amino acid ABC transporter permease [Acidimicrobiales bacterium]